MELDYIKQKALIRILDDDEALGAALKLYLELDGWQVAAYTSARRFFAEDRPSVPGCLVLDVRMPELTGLECHAYSTSGNQISRLCLFPDTATLTWPYGRFLTAPTISCKSRLMRSASCAR